MLVVCLAHVLASFTCFGELAIAIGMDGFVVAEEFVLGGDIADGAVEADVVVMGHEIGHDDSGFVEREGHLWADAIAFEGFVPAFDFAIRLGVIGRSSDMGHAGDADEFLKVLGDELRPVVADDAWRGAGEFFAGALNDGGHLGFLHGFTDFPVDDEAAVAVEEAAQGIKRTGDIEKADVHMPLLVRPEGLDEAGAFLGDVGRLARQESGFFEDAIDAGGAASDDVVIEHHEGHTAITFEGILASEVADAHDLVLSEPMIARNPGVVFVDLAKALDPVVVFAGSNADPGPEPGDGDVGFVGPGADEIDDRVAGVMGNPTFVQSSPFLFFSSVSASMSSAMTSFLRTSLASSS